MPKLYLLSMLLAFLAACSKDKDNRADGLADGTVQYKVNGNLVTLRDDENRIDKIPGGGYLATSYSFSAASLQGYDQLNFSMVADSLRVGNYVNDSASVSNGLYFTPPAVAYNGELSILHFTADYVNIVVSKYSNGLVSGSFTARLSPALPQVSSRQPLQFDYSKRGTILITDGLFKNVPCFY